jgi:hypothetical protein
MNEVSGSVNSNDYIDEIQDLKLQLGKKDIIIVKHESELKSLKMQINGIILIFNLVLELSQSNGPKSDSISIIAELQSKLIEKDHEINNIISSCANQQRGFQKTLNGQMEEIDEKNTMINELTNLNKILEERVGRLKQAA